VSELRPLLATIQANLASHENLGRELAEEWKAFGAAVRHERLRRGISIRKMALAVGIIKTSLDYKERGKCVWTIAEAKRAIKYFDSVKAPAEPVEIETP